MARSKKGMKMGRKNGRKDPWIKDERSVDAHRADVHSVRDEVRNPEEEHKTPMTFKPIDERVDRYDVQAMRQAIITSGFGMSVPAFRNYSASDEETYIPLGIVHGYYSPAGQAATSELYSQFGDLYLQRILASLTNLGYENDYTITDLRIYFNAVALRIQMAKFITDIRTLNQYSKVHSSGPVTAMTTNAINGRLVAQHRRLLELLSTMPFPNHWEDIYWEAFGPTTLSDSHFGPIRMFAPKPFQPNPDAKYEASTLADIVQASMTTFFNTPVYVELMSILANLFPTREVKPEVMKAPIGFNQSAVNNILNLPYFDGTTNEPVASDTETVRFFYRRNLTPTSTLTYAPDNNVLTTIQSTVWTRQYDGLTESPIQCVAVNNLGEAITVLNDVNLWNNFGAIWEASLALSGTPGPSVAYVNTNFTSVSTGVADIFFNK